MPYWIYDENNKTKYYKINKKLENKLKNSVCRTFGANSKFKKTYISKISSNYNILTIDKRHIKSNKIVLTELEFYCKDSL